MPWKFDEMCSRSLMMNICDKKCFDFFESNGTCENFRDPEGCRKMGVRTEEFIDDVTRRYQLCTG